jgi:hypothetical protein
MRDYFGVGPTPFDEDCAQVGTENYRQIASKEMDAYIDMLYRIFEEKIENTTIAFKKQWNSHDFGTYGEVILSYEDHESFIAFEIEKDLPANWDEKAKEYLQKGEDNENNR